MCIVMDVLIGLGVASGIACTASYIITKKRESKNLKSDIYSVGSTGSYRRSPSLDSSSDIVGVMDDMSSSLLSVSYYTPPTDSHSSSYDHSSSHSSSYHSDHSSHAHDSSSSYSSSDSSSSSSDGGGGGGD